MRAVNLQSNWSRFFDYGSLGRGRAYMRNGCVRSLRVSDDGLFWLLEGEVQGSMALPYHVSVYASLDAAQKISQLETHCTCPMALSCKHAAALLSEYFEKPGNQARAPGPAVTPEIAQWFDFLEAATASAAPAQAEKKLLHFILSASDQALKVELITLPPNSIPQRVRPQEVLSSPAFTPEEVGLVHVISHGPNRNQCQIAGAKQIPALETILKSGRAFWSKPGAGVRLGEPRPAQLTWDLDEWGYQRPRVKTNAGLEILPFQPLWYHDHLAGECGPLDTGLSPEMTRSFLRAPPVPGGEAARVDEALRARFRGVALPTIHRMEVRRRDDIKVVPVLHLFQAPNPRATWEYNAPELLAAARLRFEYGEDTIEMGMPGSIISKVENNVVVETPRKPLEEDQFASALFQFGFVHISEWAAIYNRNDPLHGSFTLGHDPEDWFDFMTSGIGALKAGGWKITSDDSFKLHVIEPSEWYADAAEQGNDWFGVELGVMVDGKKVNLLPVLQAYLARNPMALTDAESSGASGTVTVELSGGRLLAIPADRMQAMASLLAELFGGEKLDRKGRLRLNKLRAAEVPALQESQWRWKGSEELQELGRKLRNFKGIAPVTPSAGLKAELRPYQQEGLNWLQFLREYNLGGALADDMGLGKTVQALAHLLAEKDAGRMDRPSLVVAPTSLMTNWRNEAEKFAPSLRTLVLHGADRREQFEKISQHDLIVTSYALLPRDEAVLLKEKFHCVILDEAQYIKNPKTKYAQVACALNGRHRLCLTGTPMENHLGELWSLFNFALPGFLSDETRFRQAFRNPIEKRNDEGRRKILAHRIAPFVLRRRKEEVAKELPPKTEIIQNAELEGGQRDLYETIRLAMHARVLQEVAKKGVSRSHIIILDALLKLRQVCCDPRLVPLAVAKKVKQSAKLELLMDLVPEMVSEGRRILLFSQFTSMLALIEEELKQAGIPYVILTGETRDRATPINRFQQGEVPVFLISLKAGGTGLNLTAADTVIHYDPWWNPAVENQATDRAHRIGQDKQVFVYKLITAGTVEEKIVAMQARKKALVAGLLDDQQVEKLQLTAQDLEVLFSPLT